MDRITKLCQEAIAKDTPFNLAAIIAAVDSADMTSDAAFHDMMRGLFEGEPGESLLSPLDVARSLGVSSSTMQRYIEAEGAPLLTGRKQEIRTAILAQLRSAAEMLDKL